MLTDVVITFPVMAEIIGNDGLQRIFEKEVQETHQCSSTWITLMVKISVTPKWLKNVLNHFNTLSSVVLYNRL